MSNRPQAEAHPVQRWVDAFPWIEAAAADLLTADESAHAWWLGPIDAFATALQAERLADLSDLMLERLTRWTIGQIFPNLPAETDLASLPMTNRARNALARFGYKTAGDVQGLELVELFDLPNVGVGTVDSILQALAAATTLNPAPIPARRGGEAGVPIAPPDHGVESAERIGPIIEDLRTLAGWYAALGLPTRPLLDTPVPPGSPPEVLKARQRLELASAGDVLAESQAELDAAELLQRRVSMLDDRAQQILARRFFADRSDTLDEIGQDLGVTRERVRQIESGARADMMQALDSAAAGRDQRRGPGGSWHRFSFGGPDHTNPHAGSPGPAAGQPAWRVLDRLDDAYEIKDGWCAAPTILSAQTETLTRLQEYANRHGVAAVGDLRPAEPEPASRIGACIPARLAGLLRSHGGWRSRLHPGPVRRGPRGCDLVRRRARRCRPRRSWTGWASSGAWGRSGTPWHATTDSSGSTGTSGHWPTGGWNPTAGSGHWCANEIARGGGQIPMDTLIERITGKYTVRPAA